MSLAERLSRLEPRERRLLLALGVVFAFMVLLAIPIAIAATVHSQRSENDAIREAMQSIEDNRAAVDRAKLAREQTAERYSKPAPALAAFLAVAAGEVGVEIPESQDRQAVPHGKRYTERATKVVLRRVGMLKLARFMEKIEQSGHPISITGLNIRKRGVEPDSYDVDMVVSAFDRKAPEPKKAEAKEDAADAGAGTEETER